LAPKLGKFFFFHPYVLFPLANVKALNLSRQ